MTEWTFGWTQLLTIIGFLITIVIAVGGFRTFERWKREKLEERKIDIAFDCLSIAYESKHVFDHIRGIMAYSYEWKDMPKKPGEPDDAWNRRGPFYATIKRITQNKDFFERAWKLQPRCMAVFGAGAEEIFLLMHKARREIEVASEMLAWRLDDPGPEGQNRELWKQLQADIWDHGGFETEKDRVGKKLNEFRARMEALCRPVIDREYRRGKENNGAAGYWPVKAWCQRVWKRWSAWRRDSR